MGVVGGWGSWWEPGLHSLQGMVLAGLPGVHYPPVRGGSAHWPRSAQLAYSVVSGWDTVFGERLHFSPESTLTHSLQGGQGTDMWTGSTVQLNVRFSFQLFGSQ